MLTGAARWLPAAFRQRRPAATMFFPTVPPEDGRPPQAREGERSGGAARRGPWRAARQSARRGARQSAHVHVSAAHQRMIDQLLNLPEHPSARLHDEPERSASALA